VTDGLKILSQSAGKKVEERKSYTEFTEGTEKRLKVEG
jgi:hypothetical protein